jgi:uncharacterized RDD family membrane protein YckC
LLLIALLYSGLPELGLLNIPGKHQPILFWMILVLMFLNHFVLNALTRGKTVGFLLCKLRLISETGEDIYTSLLIKQQMLRALWWLIGVSPIILIFLFAPFPPNKFNNIFHGFIATVITFVSLWITVPAAFIFYIVDIIIKPLSSSKRQTLHDKLAGTIVILEE